MSVILLGFGVLYALMTLVLWWGWTRIRTAHSAPPRSTVHISVVIPVRNEAENLPHLLADLAHQTYPHFEVIVADDSSTDNTVARVRELTPTLPYPLQLLTLTDEPTLAPKKRAIAQSIRLAKGELIVTTDGDCRVGPDWLLSFATFYEQHQPKMITGPVTFTYPTGIFSSLQTVEFASLIGSGAATLALGMPTMCNGANLCYEKRVFEEVNGFAGIDQVASGDDELLMHKIAEQFPGQVRFLKNPAVIVRTAPHQNWRAFYQQRKRWASKWRAYRSWKPSALAVFVFLSNMMPVVSVWLAAMGLIEWPLVGLLVGLKLVPEYLYLRTILRFLQQPRSVRWIPLTQFVYPFYVLFFGLAAQKKGFSWKGRKLN